MPKDKKLALKIGIQTYQILTNDDEVCIPSLSSIFLALIPDSFVVPKTAQTLGKLVQICSKNDQTCN